ncbi:NAD(P)H-binding protein [Fructilactobacillus florum]|uniref:NAD(P)H-binding protein n=1 Tax=Fructilactobacillus florum TaxID=640331 RepID=UPI00028D29E7|nr:NAD(P)H-binding protein [Fructilactobacillus florum]EKK21022.1 Saccharopine dehydrogenase related protein [Fructilactobacillus florum 2F]
MTQMKQILLVGTGPLATGIKMRFQDDSHWSLTQIAGTSEQLAQINQLQTQAPLIIIFALSGHGSDFMVPEVLDHPLVRKGSIDRIIMVATAGIDQEVQGSLKYNEIDDVPEYLREQRYAVKVIDETEVPYTIFRPGDLVAGGTRPINLFAEGTQMPAGEVSYETMASLVMQAVVTDRFLNQSVGVVASSEEN